MSSTLWMGVIVGLLAGCAINTPTPTVTEPQELAKARQIIISPGDVLEVIIRRGSAEDTFTSTVRDNGIASISVVDLDVKGLTLLEAEHKLAEALTPFVKEPRVQVLFKQKVISDRFFVFGEVNKPGVFPLEPGTTIADALGKADGYNKTAYLPSVRILRGGLEHPEILPVDVDQLLYKGNQGQNLLLKNQDIVFVPRTRIGDWNRFIEEIRPTLEVITLPLQSVILGRAVKD
ncbi:MAG: SLBB domain-containing protein [Nitrospirota bacterium]